MEYNLCPHVFLRFLLASMLTVISYLHDKVVNSIFYIAPSIENHFPNSARFAFIYLLFN